MAINLSNPFSGLGPSLLEGLIPRLAQRRDEQRSIDALNPLRELVLNQFGSQVPFAGGPASEFAEGVPGVQRQPFADLLGNNRGVMVPQEPGVTATPAEPRQTTPTPERLKLPEDLRPPPGIDAALQRAAERHGVPVNALRALAAQESNFRSDVIGRTPVDLPGQEGDRARGLFQFTPAEIAKMPGFDPNDPEQAADETARRLRARLEEGKPIDIAMMEHFGGPNPELHGPRTRRFLLDVREKFQRLQEATQEDDGLLRPGAGEQVGPFGTIMREGGVEATQVQQMLAAVARDPRAFAQQFASEGGLERIVNILGGGDTSLPKQTRVISGDTPQGQAMGIQPGERARVEGTVLPSGDFFPEAVKAAPFGGDEGDGGGGPLVTLMNMKTGEDLSLRRDDPRVDELIREGTYVVASDGRALENLRNASKSQRSQLTESAIGVRTYIATVGDALQVLNENPDVNTFVAKGASIINDMRQEAKAFARAIGSEFDDSIFDVTVHEDTFRELGIENQRMKSLFTSLAFQRAVAEKGGAGRITNRDIERFLAEIGGSSSETETLVRVLLDTAHRAARAHRIRFEEVMQAPFQGDLGLDRLPRFAPREQPVAPSEAAGEALDDIPTISSDAEYEALPSGVEYVAPDGSRRRKS